MGSSVVLPDGRTARDTGDIGLALSRPDLGVSVAEELVVVDAVAGSLPFPLGVLRRRRDDVPDVRTSDVAPVLSTALRLQLRAWLRRGLNELVDDFDKQVRLKS